MLRFLIGLFVYGIVTTMSPVAMASQSYGPYPAQTYEECGSPNGSTAVAILHGGWDLYGSFNDAPVRQICAYFAAHGIYGVAFNYRLTSSAAWPAQWQDAQLMIRWLRARGFKKVGMVGTSAGGYDTLGAAFNAAPIKWAKTDPFHEAALYPGTKTTPDFSVLISPPSNMADPAVNQHAVAMLSREVAARPSIDPETVKAMISPITKVNADIGPMLIIHGTQDNVVPYAQSVNLYQQLLYIGAPVTFRQTVSGHVFAGLSYAEVQTVLRWIGNFVEKQN